MAVIFFIDASISARFPITSIIHLTKSLYFLTMR